MINMLVDPLEPSTLKGIYEPGGSHHFWHRTENGDITENEKIIEDLFEQANNTPNFEKRKLYYEKFQKTISRSVPIVYTAGELYMVAYNNQIQNTEILGSRGSFLENIEFIWKKQKRAPVANYDVTEALYF